MSNFLLLLVSPTNNRLHWPAMDKHRRTLLRSTNYTSIPPFTAYSCFSVETKIDKYEFNWFIGKRSFGIPTNAKQNTSYYCMSILLEELYDSKASAHKIKTLVMRFVIPTIPAGFNDQPMWDYFLLHVITITTSTTKNTHGHMVVWLIFKPPNAFLILMTRD